jgi:hypothetical protein
MAPNFRWSERAKLRLAQLTEKYKGYIRSDEKMTDKWLTILRKLKENSDFDDLIITPKALQTQFDRTTKELLQKYAISEEGANLSGLPASCSEHDRLVLKMAKTVHDKKQAIKEKNKKKKKKEKAMLTHEKTAMKGQGQVAASASLSSSLVLKLKGVDHESSDSEDSEYQRSDEDAVHDGSNGRKVASDAEDERYYDAGDPGDDDSVSKETEESSAKKTVVSDTLLAKDIPS